MLRRAPRPTPGPTAGPQAGPQAGFTLAELIVTVFVLALLVLGVLAMFDFAARVSRAQTQLAHMQQAQRVAQHELVRLVRMAGRGGVVPASALQILNDRPVDDPILAGGGAGVPRVVEHSDVVVVRGIFGGRIYQIDTTNPNAFTIAPGDTSGTLAVRSLSPSGVPQPIEPLEELLTAGGEPGVPEALLVVSAVDDSRYVVVELDPASPEPVEDGSTTPPTRVITLSYRTADGVNTDHYQAISTSNLAAPEMRSIAYAGVLEEYRFYVRDLGQAGAAADVPRAHELARARVFPGTEVAYRNQPSNLAVTVADDILDLQAAIGVDQNGDGVFSEGETDADKRNDDWTFNVAGDTAPTGTMGFVRLTTLARTDRPDPKYEAEALGAVEDRSYAGDPLNDERIQRLFRRWPLQSLVDLRNL